MRPVLSSRSLLRSSARSRLGLGRDTSPDRLEQLLRVGLADLRESEREDPEQESAPEQVGHALDVDVRAQLASVSSLRQPSEKRVAARADDAVRVDGGEDRIALDLA